LPKVSEEYRQARREQILDAALDCFDRSGFHQTSTRDICREAGISFGTLYLHFPSKEDIIEESWKRIRKMRAAHFEGAVSEKTTAQALDEMSDELEERLSKADTNKAWRLWMQLLSEALRNPRIRESIQENWNDTERHITELIRNAVELDVTRYDADYDAVAGLWQAVHDGLILQKIIDPEKDVVKSFKAYRSMLFQYRRNPSGNTWKRRSDDDRESIEE
jgi:AcrR family transcriptional regulator